MAYLRRPFVPSPAPCSVRLALDAVLNGPRPGLAQADADRVWLALRGEVAHATLGGRFDPREVLRPATRLASWRARRAAWAADLLRDDPRVEVTS